MSLDDLYRQVIMDHYRHPRNRGELESPSVTIELNNPLCGDEIRLDVEVEGNRVGKVRWGGRGCSISQASASMMSQAIEGADVHAAAGLVETLQKMMRGEPAGDGEDLGDIESLRGVAKYPVRIKCALLAWEALDKALARGGAAARDNGSGE